MPKLFSWIAPGLLPVVVALAQEPLPAPPSSFTVADVAVSRTVADGVAHAQMRHGVGAWQALADPDDVLHFRLAQFDPWRGDRQYVGGLGAALSNRLFVVQFQTQILAAYHDALLASGAEIVGYLPEDAYFVRCDRAVAEALRRLPMVRWLGDLQVAFKLEEPLLEVVQRAGAVGPVATEYNIVLASKSDRERLAAQIGEAGGVVSNRNDGSTYLQAKLTPMQLAAVAAFDTVLWIDVTTKVSNDMNNARIQGGANYVESLTGYSGQGIRAEITEGLETAHVDWTNPPLSRFNAEGDAHGHCTAGIVAGNGTSNPLARGMLPNAQLIESSNSLWGTASRYTVIQGSVNPALPWKAMLQTASWGNAQVTTYTSVSQEMDNALFDFDLATTQSQSNLGTQASRPQAWAKNIISVGGVAHHDNASPADDNWTSASIGPAADGRLKPDICAYYDLVLCSDLTGAAGFATTSYYTGFNGTSSATPIVCGHVGILQQMFTDGLFANPLPLPISNANRFANRPHMTTSKALLTNTAASYPFAGATANLTRTHQGWGFPNLQRAYDNRKQLVVVDEYEVLQQGQSRNYLVWIPPATAEFRATMVYADPAAVPNAAITRINNVDLKVQRLTGGTFWWGNNGLATGNVSSSGGVANDRDTIEQVWLGSPAADIYQVQVTAASVVQDGHVETPALDVDFALVMHPVGGGYNNDAGMQLSLLSSAPGDVRVQLASVPAAGWTDGFTLFSFDTARPKGFGRFFGLEDDFITAAIFAQPAAAGSVFHFTNSGIGYPFSTFAFDPALVSSLSGVRVDALTLLFGASGVVGMSNTARVTIQ